MAKTARALPNEGQDFAATGVTITPCQPATRVSLRGKVANYARIAGFKLPGEINETTGDKGCHALMLGPDEWLVINTKKTDADLMPGPNVKAYTATDISHRNTGWTVSGPLAETALAVGCPRDLRLEAFPVGACARTIFGKAEVVLLRTSKTSFRVECWRSFAPYTFGLLKEGARDAAL
jgi:sarcosine oxidase subunit gamma